MYCKKGEKTCKKSYFLKGLNDTYQDSEHEIIIETDYHIYHDYEGSEPRHHGNRPPKKA